MKDFEWASVADAPARELWTGIRLRTLWQGENGAKAQVLEMDPGTCWEGVDLHEPGPEEVYVVSGVFNDGIRDYPAGSFIHAPAVFTRAAIKNRLRSVRFLSRRIIFSAYERPVKPVWL